MAPAILAARKDISERQVRQAKARASLRRSHQRVARLQRAQERVMLVEEKRDQGEVNHARMWTKMEKEMEMWQRAEKERELELKKEKDMAYAEPLPGDWGWREERSILTYTSSADRGRKPRMRGRNSNRSTDGGGGSSSGASSSTRRRGARLDKSVTPGPARITTKEDDATLSLLPVANATFTNPSYPKSYATNYNSIPTIQLSGNTTSASRSRSLSRKDQARVGKANTASFASASVLTSTSSSRRQRQVHTPHTCSVCGAVGHNRRTCPAVVVAPQTLLPERSLWPREANSPSLSTSTSDPSKEEKNSPRNPSPISSSTMGSTSPVDTGGSMNSTVPGPLAPFSTTMIDANKDAVLASSPTSEISSRSSSSSSNRTNSNRNARDGEQLPRSIEDQIASAVVAIGAALDAGIEVQAVELLLPSPGLALRRSDGPDDWPGGVQQQFRVVLPMVQTILTRVKQRPDLQGRMEPTFLDEADAVAMWEGPTFGAVVFPTGATLARARRMLRGKRLSLVINPQWILSGNVISDVESSEDEMWARDLESNKKAVFCLRQVRVSGQVLRIYRQFPGAWLVYGISGRGEPVLLAREILQPRYSRLVELATKMPPTSVGGGLGELMSRFMK